MKNKSTTIRAKLVWALLLGAGMAGICMLLLCVLMVFASNNKSFAVFFLNNIVVFVIFFSLIFSILTIFFFLLMVKGKIKYLEEIKTKLDEISGGNLDIHIPVRSTDELGIMAQTVNDMAYKLKTSIEEERATEKTKNELITNISHDLRTPLTSILGYLELINHLEEIDAEKLAKYSTTALKQCTDLKVLIDNLFEFTKLSNADLKLNMIKLSLSELLEQVILGFIPALQKAGMEYRLSFPNEKIVLDADPTLLTRAFSNLIKNAILYGSDGKYLDVKLFRKDTVAIIQVIDYGTFIPQADIPYVFDKLYRVDNPSVQKGGTGIGLAIVKSIVALHKGSIAVESSQAATTFEMHLPIV